MGKYATVLSLINLGLLIAATACLYFGSILTNIYHLPYLDMINLNFATVPYIMLAIGAMLLLLSLFGFVAAGTESRPLLVIYAVIAGLIVLLQLASLYMTWNLKNELQAQIIIRNELSGLNDEMKLYPEDEDVKYKWDTLQREYQCCGSYGWVRGYQKWNDVKFKSERVPDSCCLIETEGCGTKVDFYNDIRAKETINIHGCFPVLNERLRRDIVPDLTVYLICCVILCLITIIALVLAAAYVASITRKEGGDDGLGVYQPPVA